MSDILPCDIDPLRLAASGGQLRGEIPVGNLPRLNSLSGSSVGQVEVLLSFGYLPGERAYIAGSINTRLALVCQRCLRPLPFDVQIEIRLLPVRIEQAAGGLKPAAVRDMHEADDDETDYETLYMTEDTFGLRDWIEDELILAIPVAPRHSPHECEIPTDYQLDTLTASPPETVDNPFAILRTAKAKQDLNL